MVSWGKEEGALLTRHLGRMQACIDQIVGVQSCIRDGVNIAPLGQHAEHTLRVLELLQAEYDMVAMITERHSPSGDADGSEWLLKELRG